MVRGSADSEESRLTTDTDNGLLTTDNRGCVAALTSVGDVPDVAGLVSRQNGDSEVSAAFAAQRLSDRVEGKGGGVIGGGEMS